MLDGFKSYYENHGNSVILDHYDMKQGLYFLINKKGIKDVLYIKDGSKDKDFDKKKLELFKYFKERDYKSKLINYDTNKSVKSKTIHSNNYLTVFAKKKSFFNKEVISSEMIKNIEEYFEAFNLYYEEEKIAKESKRELKPQVEILNSTPEFNMHLYEESKEVFLHTICDIIQQHEVQDLKDDDYIRIFYQEDIDSYNDEYRRYMVRKVFNKSNYHIKIDGDIYGLSSADMGTNPLKPSLELKGTKVKVPLKLNFETAILVQKLYDFLYFYNIRKKNKTTGEIEYVHSIYKTLYIPYDFDIEGKDLNQYVESSQPVHYIKTGNGISFNIVNYDIIPPFNKKVDFEYKDFLGLDNSDDEKSPYKQIEFIWQLESTIDYYFFDGKLRNNYFENKIKIYSDTVSKYIVNLMYISRDSFYEWFRKGNSQDIKSIIDKITYDILVERLKTVQNSLGIMRLASLLNLRLSLLRYLGIGGEELESSIKDTRESIGMKVNSRQYNSLDNKMQFFYISGQLVFFLLNKSVSTNKTQLMIRPFLKCKGVSDIKKKIAELHIKYSYAIRLNDARFNKAFSMVMEYEGVEPFKENMDTFMAGILGKNFMYTKKKIETEKNEESEGVLNEK
jgi:CRISPR-associated protein Csh1